MKTINILYFLCLPIFVVNALLLTTMEAFAEIPSIERKALIALYNSTNGPSWRDNSGWLGLEGTECQWYGVGCNDEEQFVTVLDLNINYLRGEIPDALANLTHLQWLSLDINQLTGSIPAAIGNLSQLQYLNLARNYLIGTIPKSIGGLGDLQVLHLVSNNISGRIPVEIGSLSQLIHLYLNDNNLTGSIPPEIGNLSLLQGLWLYNNQLCNPIPAEIGILDQLITLSLANNHLTGEIPEEMINIHPAYLDLCGNSLYTNDQPLSDHLSSIDGSRTWQDCQN